MSKQPRISYLTLLRDEIAALRIVKCRMEHERIVSPTGSLRQEAGQAHSREFQRIGLCSPEVRAERLGCSHTMSRVKLDEALEELLPDRAGPLRDELNWLTNQIHLLDHRKGAAEARKAKAAREIRGRAGGEEAIELAIASEQVDKMEQEHDRYVERVGQLREVVVAELDKIMFSTFVRGEIYDHTGDPVEGVRSRDGVHKKAPGACPER